MPTQPPGKIPQKKSRASMPAAERAVTFQLKAPEAKNVLLAGDFTNWRLAERPLRRSADGVWRTTIRLKPGRYEYKFIVDDQKRRSQRIGDGQ
jgi:1,4-alpha-glucan branching enzyme